MKLSLRIMVVFFAVTIGLAGTLPVFALDVPYSIGPVMVYDPQTNSQHPFFPIGWYTHGPIADLPEMYSHGCNAVHFADIGAPNSEWHFGYVANQLNLAQTLGMKIEISFYRGLITAVNPSDPNSYAPILQYVNAFKEHPALLGWHLGDEMLATDTPFVTDAAAIIRAADPCNPIAQVHALANSESQIHALMAGTDVAQFDYYAIFSGEPEFHRADDILDIYRIRGTWCSNNGWGGNVNVTQAVGCTIGSGNYRFPTYNEYRWNMCSALAATGARGFFNWIYHAGYYSDPSVFYSFRDNVVRPNFQELNRLSRGLETGYNVGTTVSNGDTVVSGRQFNKVSHLLIYDDQIDSYYLIVTNNQSSSYAVEVTISNLPNPLSSLVAEEIGSGHTVTLADLGGGSYRLTDTLLGYGAHIFILDKKNTDISGDNMSTNPGFEQGTGSNADSWVLTSGVGGRDSSLANTGAYSFALAQSGSEPAVLQYGDIIRVRPYSNYSVGFAKYHAYSDSSLTDRVSVRFYDSQGLTPLSGEVFGNARLSESGQWVRISGMLNVGSHDAIQLKIHNNSSNDVRVDDFYLIGSPTFSVKGHYNGTVNSMAGWSYTGTSGYRATSSHSADGTGCFYVYHTAGGEGIVSQWMLVSPNMECRLRWFSQAAVADAVYRVKIYDQQGNEMINSQFTNAAGWSWVERTYDFNTGNNSLITVRFVSEAYDVTNIDDVTLIPNIKSCSDVHDKGMGKHFDFNKDCYVDEKDLALFGDSWQRCTDPASQYYQNVWDN